MASADAAIGAGGTTTWERLGLDSFITYALAPNQELYSQVLDQGLIEYLGPAENFDARVLNQVLHSGYKTQSV